MKIKKVALTGFVFAMTFLSLNAKSQHTSYIKENINAILKKKGFDIADTKLTVLVAMSPECVITRNTLYYLENIKNAFVSNQLRMIGFSPGEIYSDEDLAQFKEEYKVDFPIVIDDRFELTYQLKARVTPEVFLIDQQENLLYRGAINDLYYDLGKRRIKPQNNYLLDAISANLNGENKQIDSIKAIGCIIESPSELSYERHY